MSRAFVKESDEELAAGELPERAVSDHPNYVTPRGLELLRARLKQLQAERNDLAAADDSMAKQKLLEVKRDIRYFSIQVDRAVVVDPTEQPRDEVRFGASVTIRDENDKQYAFHIVGDDEADVTASRISWDAPLAKAMIGAKVGDCVVWQRSTDATEVEIVSIAYDNAARPADR